MADKSLDILIRILTQQVGAEKAQDIVKKVTEETQKSTEATKKNTDAEGKSFTSKKQLKEAIKGLSMEFPILGRVAALALNPIAFAVAAGALAFTIWRRRAEGLIQSAGADMAGAATIGMQLPAMSAANQQNSAVAAKVSQLEELAGLNKRIAELEKSISELRSSALTDQVTAGANANTTALQAATKALKVMQTEAANLRTQANSYIR